MQEREKGKEKNGKERKGKERKGKERKGKERKGKERKVPDAHAHVVGSNRSDCMSQAAGRELGST